MLEFIAEVYFFKENSGAMPGDGWPGMMPSFNMDGELIASKILCDGPLAKEQWHEVIMQLPYGDRFEDIKGILKNNYEFKLNFGGKVFGKGIIKYID
ncbi:hypothetical protein B0P06_000420 [Clostridium saccharoperbutylacetonicum]|uniref:Uncharacterized protein n=1 Tax=Clostridium saccharoperbutylacetonicum N1-4(HMT) TaxID=931276 RepID=M1MVD9_9CLOT|nr:hypothetical protein [Clostridium saccharoperbutylacetonicum]AGF55482.1 hypothetical protein Cspa_c17120 [Clostridium saccharoperbutylacetonicum N1-4(HMT)]NRT63800.1 hypothetical protein [Clostridium saccharoperbutylacetonicum]NSB27163.1 hypothetical protein [Clostridium saccharoperbutylacetonicum]NSB40649.1 hypothetical protein [Clostridium saccharoperbutylacetonicum]